MTTIAELQAQQAEIRKQIDRLRADGKRNAIKEIKAKMAEFEITADELQGTSTVKTAKVPKAPSVIKYRKSGTETWVGRGPKPQWVKDYEAAGGSVRDFLVQ
jgi:DNA-binding protein H-NS